MLPTTIKSIFMNGHTIKAVKRINIPSGMASITMKVGNTKINLHMDKIDLDSIMNKIASGLINHPRESPYTFASECMKEAIYQALVLASENATASLGWDGHIGSEPHGVVNRQSILNVEKLIT